MHVGPPATMESSVMRAAFSIIKVVANTPAGTLVTTGTTVCPCLSARHPDGLHGLPLENRRAGTSPGAVSTRGPAEAQSQAIMRVCQKNLRPNV